MRPKRLTTESPIAGTTPQTSEPKVRISDMLGGLEVLESSHCQERVWWRKPRSKKKRISKKWELREENVRYEPRAYRMGYKLICHPSIAQRLREQWPPNGEVSEPAASGQRKTNAAESAGSLH